MHRFCWKQSACSSASGATVAAYARCVHSHSQVFAAADSAGRIQYFNLVTGTQNNAELNSHGISMCSRKIKDQSLPPPRQHSIPCIIEAKRPQPGVIRGVPCQDDLSENVTSSVLGQNCDILITL